MFVISVLGFLPRCSPNGLTFGPVCIVKRNTLNARPTLSIKSILSPRLAIIRFFNVCIARSTAPVPVCGVGGLFSEALNFTKQYVFFGYERTSTFWLCILRDTLKLMKFSKTFMTSSVSVGLHIRTTGHLLYGLIPIKIFGLMVTNFLYNL